MIGTSLSTIKMFQRHVMVLDIVMSRQCGVMGCELEDSGSGPISPAVSHYLSGAVSFL